MANGYHAALRLRYGDPASRRDEQGKLYHYCIEHEPDR